MRCLLGNEYCAPDRYNINNNPYSFFIGYQVSSEYYKQTKLLAMGSRVSEIINSDLKELNLKIIMKEFGVEEGIHITCEICKSIQESICCIFEISDLNPNVMIEIGKSLYKNVILLRNSKSNIPPSDLRGIKYIEYNNDTELTTISSKIANIIIEKVMKHNSEFFGFPRNFFLKEDVIKITKDGEFKNNVNWDDLLSIYDENKLGNPHDFTLVGIAKYKKLKKLSLDEDIDLKAIKDAERYFLKSRSKNKLILENYFYLYLLELLKINFFLSNNINNFDLDIKAAQDEFDKIIMGYKDVTELMNKLLNKDLNNFIFIDSPILIERVIQYSFEYNLKGEQIYNILYYLNKKGILHDFGKNILQLIKYNVDDRYQIIRKISEELRFEDIGEDIIHFLNEMYKTSGYEKVTEISYNIIDKDLCNKLAYLLGIFGNKKAEKILITMVDTDKENIIESAIDALARINSLKSIGYLINLFKNFGLDYPIKRRIIDAVRTLKDKNPTKIPDNIVNIFHDA